MENLTQELRAETESIRQAYAALNRNDIAGFVKDFDPQIERIEFEGTPNAGVFHGLEAVKAHVRKGRSTWAEGGCEPERLTVAGDKVVVSVHVRVRLKDQTEWLEGRTGDVFTFRDGKAIQFRTFGDESDAFAFAGLS
ncbi:MAG: nuclear transport factor 2 family protein [Acidobacteriota bacterium]